MLVTDLDVMFGQICWWLVMWLICYVL